MKWIMCVCASTCTATGSQLCINLSSVVLVVLREEIPDVFLLSTEGVVCE